MPEPTDESVSTSKSDRVRPRLEVQPSPEIESQPKSASDRFSEALLSSLIADRQKADQQAGPKVPFGLRLGAYERVDGREVVFRPRSFDESRKKIIQSVAIGGPKWETKDGKPDRPQAALKILQAHWHRLAVLRHNHDMPSDAIDTYAAFLSGPDIASLGNGFYNQYAVDNSIGGTVEHSEHVAHRDRLRLKSHQMVQSGEYRTLQEADWRYINHSAETAASTRDRIYVSAKAYGDSARVIGYWDSALKEAGIGHELMYKVSMFPSRMDTIVAYPGPDIDPEKLRLALDIFHKSCPPELLNDGVQTGNAIAHGISYAPEYFEHSSMHRLMFGEKLSFGVEMTCLLDLAMKLAYTRLYDGRQTDQSGSATGVTLSQLVQETKRCFRELLVCAGINPDTMVPFDRGGQVPEWAKPLDSLPQTTP